MTLETVERMGLLHVLAAVADGRRPALCTQFDRVLVDAPCTATGVFHRHPEARWRRSPADLHSLPRLQKQLLHRGSTLVAEGGLLVYATCSLEPEENDEVVASFLEDHPDFRREDPPHVIPGTLVDLDGFLRITPHDHGMDGMFGARLRRIGEAER
jgi:16S rRNA (cytosine967-C5)-methyltransferase